MKLTGENRSTLRKTCSSANLSTINPTWNDPGSNAGFRGERPATNRLSHGTVVMHCSSICDQLRLAVRVPNAMPVFARLLCRGLCCAIHPPQSVVANSRLTGTRTRHTTLLRRPVSPVAMLRSLH